MKRKLIVTLVLALLLAFTAFSAFAAESIPLQVNGDAVPPPCLFLVDGVSMIPLDTYVRIAGAEVRWSSADEFAITENGTTLSLSLGKEEALLENDPIPLPTAPSRTEDSVLIPIRAVGNAFGFEVGWDGDQKLVTLTRTETRDGMTASDLLAKSTVASQVYNTYTMEGLFNIDLGLTADGKAVEQAPKNMTTKLSGQLQYDPLQVYSKQTIATGVEEMPEMVVESYMNQEKMYIKAPEQGWIVQDMPLSPEFWKQQQDIQSDPLKAAAQMKEMGVLLNFGNDVTLHDKDHYAVNATMDMDKFKEGYQKILQQALQGMPQDSASGSAADMQKQIQEIFEKARIDYRYSVLINKETLISEFISFDLSLELPMKNPEPAKTDEEQDGGEPEEIKMDIKMKGDLTVSGLGDPFIAPDVSTAVETPLPPASDDNEQTG